MTLKYSLSDRIPVNTINSTTDRSGAMFLRSTAYTQLDLKTYVYI